MTMNGGEGHRADHRAIVDSLDGWDFDAEAVSDLLRVNLILHLGALHDWTVASHGGVLGLVPTLVAHDRAHLEVDVLGVEHLLDGLIIEAIRETENESP